QVGNVVTYDAFTSTSKNENWGWLGGMESNMSSFVIFGGRNGVDVDEISSNKGEGEVLYNAGTRFKVLSRTPRKNRPGVFDFVMAEVDEAGEVVPEAPTPVLAAPKSEPEPETQLICPPNHIFDGNGCVKVD
ncbi:MAG: hypothetical protein EOP11_25570, partial [Proteobacteria bacterium]